MPTYFQRPENALKRANEFIDVGKAQRALDALYDVIKSKKHRTWQKIHEPIMEKYLELCVDLRKSHIAKEGLYQYKNICQQVNINSLVDVVRKYIALAEERTEAARQESHQTVLDIDDLDLPDSPESLLLKAVSGEDTQDRTDRAILTPWVKFLWESYRQCLELLRNNSRVERLYQDIAQQAFRFCLKYSRKTEFRKLCDNLRTHLGHVFKHQHQQTAINLNNPDSQGMHLETRLVQLDSAINMELWQEAFKAVEDIHGLISLSKKQPKPSLMANYYQKIGLVFAKSGNHLFHASTLHRLFNLSREQRKNLTQEELQKMANRVLCATLAIPIPASRNAVDSLLAMDESGIEKQRRLATLLMLPSPPNRQGLVKDLVKYGALQYVTPELQNLYKYLEVEFHPLRLYPSVQPIIQFISSNEDLAMYVPHMEEIIIARVLKQVSQVYQTIEFKRFASMVPFADKHRLERVIVGAAKNMELQVRIDHRTASLSFGTDLGLSQKEEAAEGPTIQSMPSEQIRNQLTVLGRVLSKAVRMIAPDQKEDEDELKANLLNSYRLTAKKEHGRILQRRQVIEERKEQLESLNDMREREEQELAEEARRRAYELEMQRLEREAEERKKQRQEQEHMEIKRKHVRERLEELRKTPTGSKIFQNIDEEEMADLDVDEIMAKQVEQLEKEKKELQERLKGQEKKVDYMARAKRIEEIPLLQKQYEDEKLVNQQFWEQQEKERIEQMKTERMYALETKERLSKMLHYSEIFLNSLKKARKSEYEEKLKEFEKQLALERRKRLQERKEKRRDERRAKWLQEKEEAAQRARDEQLKKEREERERLDKEEREREEREYAEKLAKLEAQAERQRQREKEIEERMRQKTDETTKEKPEEQERSDKSSWRRGDKDVRGEREGGRGEEGEKGGESKPWRPSQQRWKDEPRDRASPREEGDWRKSGRDDRGPDDRGPRDDRRDRAPDSWRDRGPARDGPRDDRGPARDDRRGGDSWRDKAPARDDFDNWRRGPPRDDRGPLRRDDDRAPVRRDDDRPLRRGDDDRAPMRREDDKGPIRRDDDRGPRRDDDRGPRRDDDRGPRRDDDRGLRRDDDRGPRRDDDRGLRRDDDRPFRRSDDDRGPSRRDVDRGPMRRDDDRGLRRDEDRGPMRRDDDRDTRRDERRPKESWRDRTQRDDRGGEDWRSPREDRGPPRDDRRDDRRGGEGWRERRSGGGGEERSWREAPRSAPKDDASKSKPREDKPPSRGPPKEEGRGTPRVEKKGKPEQTEDDDGWTTVRY